ncbi:hypothetical protein H310_07773 [Aphanomyces invadans]|uniref:Uncharacterized protein n=1 Tax=Aphanomyces invadans TaxID=157072 RepID=A0A024U0C4_9STRA|nr:hypothetical protein H310_07773 [Aphanomyces invadans]ETV99713.1 hypothetical protein H310_07773 [Aphanomyces invadans]|eukprot:XP_008871489.1 hypothetical protein H310_07773 [Aphanomyces invadans]
MAAVTGNNNQAPDNSKQIVDSEYSSNEGSDDGGVVDEGDNDPDEMDVDGGDKDPDEMDGKGAVDDNPRPNKKAKSTTYLTRRLESLDKRVVDAAGMYALQYEALAKSILMLDARVTATAARAYNMPLSNELHLDAEFQVIQKIIPGHPSRPSPPEGFDEHATFGVGAVPPPSIHMLIATVRSLDGINHHDQLDAIHWFYNDPRLAHVSGSTISQRRIALRSFLCR